MVVLIFAQSAGPRQRSADRSCHGRRTKLPRRCPEDPAIRAKTHCLRAAAGARDEAPLASCFVLPLAPSAVAASAQPLGDPAARALVAAGGGAAPAGRAAAASRGPYPNVPRAEAEKQGGVRCRRSRGAATGVSWMTSSQVVAVAPGLVLGFTVFAEWPRTMPREGAAAGPGGPVFATEARWHSVAVVLCSAALRSVSMLANQVWSRVDKRSGPACVHRGGRFRRRVRRVASSLARLSWKPESVSRPATANGLAERRAETQASIGGGL